MKIENSFHMR